MQCRFFIEVAYVSFGYGMQQSYDRNSDKRAKSSSPKGGYVAREENLIVHTDEWRP